MRAHAACPGEIHETPASQNLVALLCAQSKTDGLQSLLFGAWKGDQPLLTLALGQSFSGVPAATGMHFRAGIMETEALVAILLQLVDAGQVKLDEPIGQWLPTLPHADKVTLQMLADSRSGYPDYLDNPRVQAIFTSDPFQPFTNDQILGYAMSQPMAFTPGAGFHYAHTNIVILGLALQKITGLSVAQLLQERIFSRLGLDDTKIPTSADIQAPVQHAFTRDRGFYEDSTYFDPSWASYTGTLTTDLRDLAVFQRALGTRSLLSKAGLAELLTQINVGSSPQMTKQFYYGLGVIVANTWILEHARVSGYDVVMAYLPSRDLTIVVSSANGVTSTNGSGYSASIFKDVVRLLAPERPIPDQFI
ncbi:MAG TPA: serine hydrolase domain-containing protein [Candidatus Acidoferrales bacterium]|nr:serine hydrolase domain-containing protein [Candidatus Acidoferrales bacterium]